MKHVCIALLITFASVALPPSDSHAWVSKRDKDVPRYKVPFKPKWVRSLKKEGFAKYKRHEFASPVSSKELVFVGSNGGYFYAFWLKNGFKKWRFRAEGAINSTATLWHGKVFFGDDNGVLYALEEDSGKLLWKNRYRSPILAAPLVVGDRIYFVTSGGNVYSVDAATGEGVWVYPDSTSEREMTIYGQGTPAFVPKGSSGGWLYVGLSDGSLIVLDTGDGRLVWSKSLADGDKRFSDIDMQPLVDGERVYVASFSEKLFSLDRKNGSIVWTADIGSGVRFSLAGEVLYVSASDGTLYALNKSTGAVIWKLETGKGALTQPIVYHDLVAVGSGSESMLFVDARSGTRIMQRFARKNISSDPVLAGEQGDLLVYLSNGGHLYALRLKKNFHY